MRMYYLLLKENKEEKRERERSKEKMGGERASYS
jgi:hypothetical protein